MTNGAKAQIGQGPKTMLLLFRAPDSWALRRSVATSVRPYVRIVQRLS